MSVPITPAQMREARLLLRWPLQRLANKSDTSVWFVTRYEECGYVVSLKFKEELFDGLAAVRTALEQAGVEFTNGDEPGVKLRKVQGSHG